MQARMNDGAVLSYSKVGHGQPVILIHGFGGYRQIWTRQVPFLVSQGYQVISYDHRGHGASAREPQPTSIKQLVDDLVTLMQVLHVERPVLMGHSMGAAVIYGLFHYYPELPVWAAVAIDQSPKMLNAPDWKYGFMDITRANYRTKLATFGHVKETLNGVDDQVYLALKEAKAQYPVDQKTLMPLMYDHARRDWRAALAATTVPTLLVTANQSPFFDGAFGDVMAENNQLITHQRIDQTGHCVMAEQPAAFNRCVQEFLA